MLPNRTHYHRWLGTVACTILLAAGLMPGNALASTEFLLKFNARVDQRTGETLIAKTGASVLRYFSEIGVYRIKAKSAHQFKKHLGEIRSEVEYVEENHEVHLIDTTPLTGSTAPVEDLAGPPPRRDATQGEPPAVEPNDPYFRDEDRLRELDVEHAWALTTGSKKVLVAVSDTGSTHKHRDLQGVYWVNPREVPGNHVDDDHNGYVDDVLGWSTLSHSDNTDDHHGHGTHVAGIIGAVGNDGKGMVGVNWQVTIMPVQFLDSGGSGTTADAIETILYAANNGARLINCSWGSDEYSRALLDAINYAYSKNTLVIAAAGNDSRSADVQPMYPAGYDTPAVVSVAASEYPGRLAYFSNVGHFAVDLAAPGQDVLSTLPYGYGRWSGTSMATPMVTGIGALILSLAPDLSAKDLRNAILNSVSARKDYADWLATGGDANAYLAVKQLGDGFQLWPQQLTLAQGTRYPFTAYHAQGKVSWSSVPSSVATIDSNGVLTASGLGDVLVSARDSTGALVQSRRVRVVEDPKASSGCGPSKNMERMTGIERASAQFSFGLPFLVGLLAIGPFRRRRRSVAGRARCKSFRNRDD